MKDQDAHPAASIIHGSARARAKFDLTSIPRTGGSIIELAGSAKVPAALVFSAFVSNGQKYRLRSAGYRRDIVAPLVEGFKLIDRQSGTPFEVVGEALPLAPTQSALPWSPENLRHCGCSREQLVQRDVNDCPYCDRRLPAAAGAPSDAV